MEYVVSDNMKNIKISMIRTISEMAKKNMEPQDRFISFAAGFPATDALPDDIVSRYSAEVLEEQGKEILQYGTATGYEPLKKAIRKFINTHETIASDDDDIMITYGSNEIMYFAAALFVNPGDTIIVENPTFMNAINQYKLLGANVVGVPVEDDGVNIQLLEEAMKKGAKFFYTIPTFGNPSSITMSEEKRKAVYDLAVKYHVLILEDNPYGYLRFHGKTVPTIKSLDKEGIVMYAGTFSKIISPGMRTGYLCANKALITKFNALKSASSNANVNWSQYTIAKFLENTNMDDHIAKISKIYEHKAMTMYNMMVKCFPKSVTITKPEGGLFIWVTMPKGAKALPFCEEVAKKLHISIVPGNEFCTIDPDDCTSMRFSYSLPSDEDIEYGIEQVGKMMTTYCQL